MLATELALGRSGAIDTDLSGAQPFYGTDFTKPLLFLEDGAVLRQPGDGRSPHR